VTRQTTSASAEPQHDLVAKYQLGIPIRLPAWRLDRDLQKATRFFAFIRRDPPPPDTERRVRKPALLAESPLAQTTSGLLGVR
jgi:hypothetical protein